MRVFSASPAVSVSAAGGPLAPQAIFLGNMLFGARISSVLTGHFWCELRKATFAYSYLQKTDDERQKVRDGDMSPSLE